ncbi:hypothetical protein PFISCL1PPCAC_12673, partial [Pristionchus fissidentatus]
IPILPEVGSISTFFPGEINPLLSASSIMANPARSFTDPAGFMYSNLTAIFAGSPFPMELRRTRGVLPIAPPVLAQIPS